MTIDAEHQEAIEKAHSHMIQWKLRSLAFHHTSLVTGLFVVLLLTTFGMQSGSEIYTNFIKQEMFPAWLRVAGLVLSMGGIVSMYFLTRKAAKAIISLEEELGKEI